MFYYKIKILYYYQHITKGKIGLNIKKKGPIRLLFKFKNIKGRAVVNPVDFPHEKKGTNDESAEGGHHYDGKRSSGT